MSDAILNLRDHSGRLLIPGVEFQSNRLVIDGELGSETLKELIRFCNSANNSSIWWMADLLVWLKATKGEPFALEVAAQSDNSERLIDAMRVAENLKIRFRVSYHHHREAFLEAGRDATLAAEWLAKAEESSWSVSEMRREIRQSQRTVGQSSASSGCASITGELGRLKAKLRTILAEHPLNDWSEQELAGIRLDFEPIARLLDDVERQLQELNCE